MPTRSGWAARAAVALEAAISGLSLEYSWPMYLRPGVFLISSSNPLARASVVEMPGLTLMTRTEPLPPVSSARVRAASRPPSSLSEAISDSASSAPFSVVVSTNTSLIPAALAWVSGGIIA